MGNTFENIDKRNLPKHIAVIMDGNGRWAKRSGNARIFGHKNGVRAVRQTTEAAAELGLEYLTLYVFSNENWNRPQAEVDGLMDLLVSAIKEETKTLNKNNIQLLTIGRTDKLPEKTRKKLESCISSTSKNTGLKLILALSYSSREEITEACKEIASKAKSGEIQIDDITEETISNHLYTKDIPDPSLLIRTSGEFRISNFLLWQISYSEIYITDILWPDFDKLAFCNAILSYQQRERRFGKTSEQIIDAKK